MKLVGKRGKTYLVVLDELDEKIVLSDGTEAVVSYCFMFRKDRPYRSPIVYTSGTTRQGGPWTMLTTAQANKELPPIEVMAAFNRPPSSLSDKDEMLGVAKYEK